MNVNVGLRRAMTWPFVIADVTTPILGADFLEAFGLLVDLKNCQLVDSITNLSSVGTVTAHLQWVPFVQFHQELNIVIFYRTIQH